MPTRLKRLELHGFKSFATPTVFVFDPGITAIIGPNGSGKSNIADGMRWVLGEQSYASLRGRRTEDVIFSGSTERSPLGMAEVALTLDNEAGDLPLPFSEITVVRRAYRSGENQYFINGARVRLKDVSQVTASLGQAYTVIGQGLVDAVLSQRPEERRGLFEHAAGITGLRLKHADAERQLAETQANITRLEDLLAEIEPRLRTLERAARQARELEQVRSELRDALERSYGRQWRAAVARRRRAEDDVARADVETHALERLLARAHEAMAVAEQRAANAHEIRESLVQETQHLREEHRSVQHDLALTEERLAAHERRQKDLLTAFDSFRISWETGIRELEQMNGAAALLEAQIGERERQIAALTAAEAETRSRRAALQDRRRAAEGRAADLERRLLAGEARAALLQQQREDLIASRAQVDVEAAERARQTAAVDEEIARAGRAVDAARARVERLAAERERAAAALDASVAERDKAEARVRALERRLVERSTRLETLEHLRESGAGLFAGTHAVLEAARRGVLGGVVGPLASLLRVPIELEAAIEAALGGHLQDVVVERWSDAELAIEHLRRGQAGRATFQPLDTVRGGPTTVPPRTRGPGIRGIAAELIDFDPRAEVIVRSLLGRILVADDMDATRSALGALPPGWSVVTLSGEITRSSGAVTGGARVKESGALARERELRDLPTECARLEQDLAAARADHEVASSRTRARAAEQEELDRDAASAREALRDAGAERDRLLRWRDELGRARANDDDRQAEIERRLRTLDTECDALGQTSGDLRAEYASARDEVEQLGAELDAEDDGSNEALQQARSSLSELLERRRNLRQQTARLQEQQAGIERQIADVRRRQDAASSERAALGKERERLEERLAVLATSVEGAACREAPIRETLAKAIEDERAARDSLAAIEARRREAEREHDRLALDTARRRDEVDLVVERAARDLEVTGVLPILERAPTDDGADAAALDREIARLRERLRRIGTVGDDAIEQYAREAERYAFLRGQLDDVKAAGDALRALLDQLERTMVDEFDHTFGAVAAAFEETFSTLFGGGRARLIRAGEEGALGVDIVAQPSGKRSQNLALLSGGERALTAVALLFAILKVNPSPFCLLDEVDAALDEANVVRVRDELRALTQSTQFVVVTHNRATIEGADTLYGITMGDDGISKVLSLRLPAEAPV